MSQPTAQDPPSLCNWLQRRPAFSAAVLLIAGIVAHPRLIVPTAWLLPAILLLITLALAARKFNHLSIFFLAIATILVGLLGARLQARHFAADHIAHFTNEQRRLARLELRITEPPRTVTRPGPLHRPVGHGRPTRHVAQAQVLRIRTHDGWTRASGITLLHLDDLGEHHPLAVNQRIVALGMLQQPAAAMNPGEFDWRDHYRQQRILASLHIADAGNIRILGDPGPGLLHRLQIGARELLAKGFSPDDSLDHALLRALVLGDKDPQLRDVQDDFTRTGTSHHLVISGAHIMILGGFIFLICRILLLSPRVSVWIALVCVGLYGLVALPSPPVIRSMLLCFVFGFGLLKGRSLDGVQLLSVTVCVMLVVQPLDLYDAGFQLSFATVLGLMTLTTPLLNFFASFEDPDVKVARSIRPPTGLPAALLRFRGFMLQVIAAGAVAWAVSAPLIALLFRQLNPWAIPGSLLLAPVVILALIGGLLKVVITLILPFFAAHLATLAAQPIAWMRHMVDWLAEIPGSDVPIMMPGALLFVVYALLYLPQLVRPTPRLRWCIRCSPAAAVAGILALPLLAGWTWHDAARSDLRVTLLSVGAGQCAAVHLPSGRLVLLDAGSLTISDVNARIIEPYLRHDGRRRVDSVFISHANYDHYSAVPAILSDGRTQEIFLTPHFVDDARDSAAAASLLQAAANRGTTVRHLSAGDFIPLDDETSLTVLWPSPEAPLKPNDTSLVLRLQCRGRSILFTGDIQEPAQRILLSQPDDLRADVLVAPHHGSTEPTTADFIEAVNPQYILSSNDHTLSQKQRRLELLCRDRLLLRTHECGAITVSINSAGELEVKTFRQVPRGRNRWLLRPNLFQPDR